MENNAADEMDHHQLTHIQPQVNIPVQRNLKAFIWLQAEMLVQPSITPVMISTRWGAGREAPCAQSPVSWAALSTQQASRANVH